MHNRIRRKWAGIVTGVMFAPDVASTSSQVKDSGSAVRGYDPRPLGWALKVTKQPTQMTDNVKTFLMKKFKEGARTGNKADPVQVAREMKTLRNAGGEPIRKPLVERSWYILVRFILSFLLNCKLWCFSLACFFCTCFMHKKKRKKNKRMLSQASFFSQPFSLFLKPVKHKATIEQNTLSCGYSRKLVHSTFLAIGIPKLVK